MGSDGFGETTGLDEAPDNGLVTEAVSLFGCINAAMDDLEVLIPARYGRENRAVATSEAMSVSLVRVVDSLRGRRRVRKQEDDGGKKRKKRKKES